MKIFFYSETLRSVFRKAEKTLLFIFVLSAQYSTTTVAAATNAKKAASHSGRRCNIDPVTITGKVTDVNNNPLPDVNVVLKGTQTGAVTDIDGKYSLRLPQNSGTVVFTFIGFTTKEVVFEPGKTVINVQLAGEAKGLNEVVVIGYGTQKRGEITSAVASVKSENFVKGAVGDAAQLIRGKVAGLSVVTPDGNPTATAQVNLRGIATLNASTTPLVIIDGVPGSLTSVAPEDIESIDVLKDGSAAAIYGTRGTNGVILITTRKSKGITSPTMEINTYFSTQRITRRLQFFNADQYRQLVQEKKPGATDYGSSTNWLDQVLQKPFSKVYNVDLRGSNERTNYIVNLNFRDLNGIMLKSNNKVVYPRIEVNHSMFDGMLKLNANINGYEQNYNGFDGGGFRGDIYRNAIYLNPTQPVKNPDGTYSEHVDKTDYANPVSLITNSDGIQQNTDLRTSGSLTLTPINDLDIKLLGSRDLLNNFSGYSETKEHYSTLHDGKNGYAARGAYRNEEDLLELTANYRRTLRGHTVTGLAGYSWRQNDNQSFYAQNYDFPSDDYSYNSLQSGRARSRGQAVENSYRSQNRLVGYFFRVNYGFKDKYLLMASIRREGSSKFGTNHKYGNFPAASIGWNAKKESFLINNHTISSLKFRAGYGITGTEPLSPYLSLDRINFNTNTFINGQWIQAINPSSNANPDLRWERKKEFNAGLDLGIFDNRLTLTADYYNRTTSDLLFNYPVATPPYLYDNITANAASMENKGVEIGLNFEVVQSGNFVWNTQVNYSTNKNKILSLSDKNFQLASGYFDAGFLAEPIQTPTSRVQIGQPVGNFYGFQSVDVDDAGHWIILGKDGKPKPIVQAQADDKQIIGNGLPKQYLSWNNSFSYQGFDLNVTMRGAFGFQILNTPRIWYDAPVMLTRGNLLVTAYDNVYGKRPLADDQSVSYVSNYIENGSYWKIDNVTLGYNLQLKTKYIKSIRVYASGSNVKTFTKYNGIDPEVGILGLAPGVDNRDRYPATSTYTLGAFLNF